MNRDDLQKLARLRAKEARTLLDSKQPSGAFYLCGYSVECALKACIAKQTRRFEFPELQRVKGSYTHNLVELLRLADLQDQMRTDSTAEPLLEQSWTTVQRWTEASRYVVKTQAEARDMIRAATGKGGMLPWIVQRW